MSRRKRGSIKSSEGVSPLVTGASETLLRQGVAKRWRTEDRGGELRRRRARRRGGEIRAPEFGTRAGYGTRGVGELQGSKFRHRGLRNLNPYFDLSEERVGAANLTSYLSFSLPRFPSLPGTRWTKTLFGLRHLFLFLAPPFRAIIRWIFSTFRYVIYKDFLNPSLFRVKVSHLAATWCSKKDLVRIQGIMRRNF